MKNILALLAFLFMSSNTAAQFSGPSEIGTASTVAQIAQARLGSYVSVTGFIIAHQRGDYFTFQDASGTIRVEIEKSVWQHRPVGPETKVRLLAEIESGTAGRYLWVKSLEVIN